MSNSNSSLTRILLLQKLEHKSLQRTKPDISISESGISNLPELRIQNIRSGSKTFIAEDSQIQTQTYQKVKKYIRLDQRESSLPVTQKRALFRKQSILKSSEKKQNILMIKTLACYFEYRPISLAVILGKREEYMFSLKSKKRDINILELNPLEIKHRLEEFYQKQYRKQGRKHFNINTNQQLKSMKFVKKQQSYTSKKKKHKDNDSVGDQEQECEETDKVTDYPTWKRRNGIGLHQKVFIVKGGYEYLRKGLIERGWVQNEDVWSPFFDLKWTTKQYDINYNQLSPDQIVNHFNYNEGLISKFGLAQSLRIFSIKQKINVNKFFPRCFDLTIQGEFQDFIENFKFTFAESILNKYLADPNRYRGLQLKVRLAIKVIEKRLMTFKQRIQLINTSAFYFINPVEWAILTETDELTPEQKQEWLNNEVKKQTEIDRSSDTFQEDLYIYLSQIIKQKLAQLKDLDPQTSLSGHHNVWIVKPKFLSRGRGINCFNNLFDICNYCFGKDLGFVVQKYIEKPLLVQGRKFDIRQWVLIEGYNPPKVWSYDECYLRFSAEDYTLDNISNKFVHLTNNSIQKYGSKFQKSSIPGNMWGLQEFVAHIGEANWISLQEKMRQAIVLSIKSCEPTIAPRKNTYELVGYDFMVDEQFNPWLIEVNMSPAMDYSTKVTERLVKKVLSDTVKVIVDKKGKDKGGFKCIYSGGKYQSQHYSIE